MHRYLTALLLMSMSAGLQAETASYDYFAHNRLMIRNGVQAVLMCNGLFTSNRSLEQVFRQELAYLPNPVGDTDGGAYRVNTGLRAVIWRNISALSIICSRLTRIILFPAHVCSPILSSTSTVPVLCRPAQRRHRSFLNSPCLMCRKQKQL